MDSCRPDVFPLSDNIQAEKSFWAPRVMSSLFAWRMEGGGG